MAYPQRPPPQRNYAARPGPPPDQWQGYDQGGYYGQGDPGYNDYGGYGDYGYYDQGGYDPGYAPRSRRDQYPPRMPPQGRPRGGPPRDRGMDPRGPRDPRDPRDPRLRHDKSFNRPPPMQQPPKPRPGDRRMMPPNSPGGPKFSDSPFPTMPAKQGSAVDQTMDQQMAALDINGKPGRPRPAEGRPHTSNHNRPHPGRHQTDPVPFDQPDPAWGNGGGGGMPPPKRSATMPVNPAQQGAYPGQSTWQEPPPGGNRYYGPGPQRPGTAPGMKPSPSDSPIVPPVPQSQTPISTPPEIDDHKDPATDFLDDYYDTTDPPEPDMPNFNAMPGGAHGNDDLIPGTNSKSEQSKPESGGGYTAYKPPGGVVQPMTPPKSNMNQFDNAGFQFDLPDSSSDPYDRRQPPDDYGYGQPPPSRGGMYGDPTYNGGESGRGGRDGYGGYGQQPPPNQYGPDAQPGTQNMRPMQTGTPAPGNPPSTEPSNPDALPHHPVPFRPGLDQGSKPAPVRQYDNPPPQNGNAAPPTNEPGAAPTITHTDLMRLQQVAKNNPSDQKTQLQLAEKLVEASVHLIDDNGRADMRTKNKNRERYILDAHKIVKKLVSAGYPPAMFYLADCYGQGSLGLQVDQREAFNLYQSAAKGGHPESAYRLAVCCEMGHEGGGGTKRDPIKAVQWYRRAAALGDTPAMYKMGIILLKGLLGQQRNPREAVSWLKRAAERANEENPHALHELALLYENPGNNDTIIRDEQYAMELLLQAAELGYKFSQHRLGAAFEYGLMGCPVDARQSIIWYTRAAAQGEHQSELSLSGWYLTGSDGILQQSDTEAYLWARKAALAGLAKAEYAMGYFSEVGIGVPANLEDAKRWYWKASSQNFLKARERLEDLRRGGAKMQKTRVSRSAVNRQNEGDCVVM